MAAVPNACYAATNTYANFHKQKIIIETSDESTPPSSPNRTRYPSGGPGSPAKWINSALHYFHFPGRPRSSGTSTGLTFECSPVDYGYYLWS
ncbi:uncharacterized protein [Ptychodera flava]|uniref:uncharacterized protein isoform X2 n=1 Tax=Ptychodera flava TaxID=63121 RepID=UPI00396A4C7C